MKKSVFLGFTTISYVGLALEKGLNENGYFAKFYSFDETLDLPQKMNFVKFIRLYKMNYLKKKSNLHLLYRLFYEFIMFFFFLYSIVKFDVFIFICISNTFLYKNIDLIILKLLNKKIIILEMGSDVRPVYIDGSAIYKFSLKKIVEETKKKKIKIAFIEKYSDYILSEPPMAIFHKKKFIKILSVGLPRLREEYNINKIGKTKDDYLKIVHAPSDIEAKGTIYIRKIVDNLKNKLSTKKIRIEYIELNGIAHEKVIKIMSEADIVIDQAYADIPFSGCAFEAALLKKPVIIGGEYAQYINKDYKEEDIFPSIYVLPENMESAIESLILDKEKRIFWGEKAYEFVNNKWAYHNVINNYIDIINENAKNEWFYDPEQLEYFYGGFAPLEKIKCVIVKILEIYGIKALKINDKEKIKKEYLSLLKWI